MASQETTTQRPSTNLQPPTHSEGDESKHSARKIHFSLSYSCPFDIPPTPESAAVRIVKNLGKFSLLYTIFIWTVLFIALIPARKVSIVYLVSMTEVTFLYVILPHAVPEAVVLNRIIDRRIVLFFLFVITSIMMIATEAAIHLFVVLAATIPVVMVHAVLSKREDVFVGVEAGEMVSLVDRKDVDTDPENFV